MKIFGHGKINANIQELYYYSIALIKRFWRLKLQPQKFKTNQDLWRNGSQPFLTFKQNKPKYTASRKEIQIKGHYCNKKYNLATQLCCTRKAFTDAAPRVMQLILMELTLNLLLKNNYYPTFKNTTIQSSCHIWNNII